MTALLNDVEGLDPQVRSDINHIATAILAYSKKCLYAKALMALPVFVGLKMSERHARLEKALHYGKRLFILKEKTVSQAYGKVYEVMPSGDIRGVWKGCSQPQVSKNYNKKKYPELPLRDWKPEGYEQFLNLKEMMALHKKSEIGIVRGSGGLPAPVVRVGSCLLWESEAQQTRTKHEDVAVRGNVVIRKVDQAHKAWVFDELHSMYRACQDGMTSVQKDKLEILKVMVKVV